LNSQENSEQHYILVLDTSTIIVLEELNALNILRTAAKASLISIMIPQAVERELQGARHRVDLPKTQTTIEYKPQNLAHFYTKLLSLGEGERSTILTAYTLILQGKNNVVVVTDDLEARRVCERLGIRVVGTLGLIELLKKCKAITKEKALEMLQRISSTSLRITQKLLNEAHKKISMQ
jgi:predicted nucleic acid-binding protein